VGLIENNTKQRLGTTVRLKELTKGAENFTNFADDARNDVGAAAGCGSEDVGNRTCRIVLGEDRRREQRNRTCERATTNSIGHDFPPIPRVVPLRARGPSTAAFLAQRGESMSAKAAHVGGAMSQREIAFNEYGHVP